MAKNTKPGSGKGTEISGNVSDNIVFRKLIENSYSGILLLNKSLQVIYQSPSAKRICGWPDNMAKNNFESHIHPDDKEMVTQVLQQVLQSPDKPYTCTFLSYYNNDHYIRLAYTFTNLLHDADVNAIVCNFIDITDKKDSEEILQKTIRELSAYKYALDEASIVAITDQKGVILHVNDNFCKISKFSREELLGQDHRIINSSYHDAAFIRQIWTTIANGNIWKGELKNKAKDGSYYWVDTTIVPFLNDNGKPYQYVAIRSDVTERKLNEEKIIENARFIKTITDHLPAMMAYWTDNLHCLFANKPYLEWFDKLPDQMQGIHKSALMDKAEYEQYLPYIKKVLQGEPQSFERTFIKENGRKIYTHTQYLPDKDNGVTRGFYSLIYDITEIKLAELEVKKQTEQVEYLLESITDGFIGLDKNLCYTYANKQVGLMLGLDPETLIGKNVWEVFPEAIGSATYNAIQKAFTDREFVTNEDYYPPLNLWQENRVYPTGEGLSVFIRDITKRKHEEERLKLLESVIINTTDAVLITEAVPLSEPGPRIIYANEAFSKMTGFTTEEVIGKTPRILQGPKSDKTELDRLSKAIREQQNCEITTINYKKTGEEFWVNFSVSPVLDNKGNCTHFIAIERDITERKLSERQIAQLNERFTLISKATNDALFEWNFEKKEIWWSESHFILFGFDPRKPHPAREEWLAKLTVESREVVAQILDNIENNDLNTWQKEISYHKPDGSIGTLLNRGFVIRDAYHKPVRMLGSYQDITLQKKQEQQRLLMTEAIAESLKERNVILESIGDAFFAVDNNWTVTYWNKVAEKILRKTKGVILGKSLWEVFPESVNSESYKSYQQALKTKQAIHFEDFYQPLEKWYEISAYPSPSGLSVYFKDITERKMSDIQLKELNLNLQKQAKELAISNAELEQFAYVASHDLQEPLRMITSFLTQIEKKYGAILDDKGKQYIFFAVDGAKRMRQIILDLLEFSRIGQGDEGYQNVNINTIVHDVLALYHKLIEDTGATVEFARLPVIKTLKVPIRQVFQNLISNSLKYQKKDVPAVITITCESLKAYWKFAVSDNGIGIDPEYFEKIFIIFQRLHNKNEFSGTGMGLAVTKKIVENLGGAIWVESEEGKGSTFYFTILKTEGHEVDTHTIS